MASKFDTKAMSDLVALAALPGVRPFLESEERAPFWTEFVVCLVAYEQNPVTPKEQAKIDKLAEQLATAKETRDAWKDATPATVKRKFKDAETFADLAASHAEHLEHLAGECTRIAGEKLALQEKPLLAGVKARATSTRSSGPRKDVTNHAYSLPFATEGRTLVVAVHGSLAVLLENKREITRTPKLPLSETGVRKLAHAWVRGVDKDGKSYKGQDAVDALEAGVVKWGDIDAGGVGHDHDLVKDLGDSLTYLNTLGWTLTQGNKPEPEPEPEPKDA